MCRGGLRPHSWGSGWLWDDESVGLTLLLSPQRGNAWRTSSERMPGRAGTESGGCTLSLLEKPPWGAQAPLCGQAGHPASWSGDESCTASQAAPSEGLSRVRAGSLVPCGCRRHQAALPILPWAGPPVLPAAAGAAGGTPGARQGARGAVQGGPGHLAGPCKREFLSFILLINTIYFIFLAGLQLCMPGKGVHAGEGGLPHVAPTAVGMSTLSQVVGVPGGWVGGAGSGAGAGRQAGMCWQGPCLLPRSSCSPEQRGPCRCTGRATSPALRRAVMWLRCRPQWAGGFLPCPSVGARAGGWDLPLPPLLCTQKPALRAPALLPIAPPPPPRLLGQ